MAVRNGSAYLGDAIDSVLVQSVTDFEYLIVDDASNDGTAEILSRYAGRDRRIRVLRNDNRLGPYPSVNRALASARGRFVARHDADDISPPDRFAAQLEALESVEGISLVTGAVEVFGTGRHANSINRPPAGQSRLEWELLFGNVVGAGAHVMFPRVLGDTPILYSTAHEYAEDYGLWCRLCRLGRVSCPQNVVYKYRQHASSITESERPRQEECLSALRRDYQALYFGSQVTAEISAEVSRFWTGDGRPHSLNLTRAASSLMQLRSGFLTEIERRHGQSERVALEADIDEESQKRIGYWLFRSIRFADLQSSLQVLASAGGPRNRWKIAREAFRLATRSGLKKARPV